MIDDKNCKVDQRENIAVPVNQNSLPICVYAFTSEITYMSSFSILDKYSSPVAIPLKYKYIIPYIYTFVIHTCQFAFHFNKFKKSETSNAR